jgi:hypothetical protein
MENDSKVFFFYLLVLMVFHSFYFSGKIVCKEDFFVMMLPPVKPRFDDTSILCFSFGFCVYLYCAF